MKLITSLMAVSLTLLTGSLSLGEAAGSAPGGSVRHGLNVESTRSVGKTIGNIVDLTSLYDWGAISSYPGLGSGPMGIANFWHSWDGLYFPSDSLDPFSGYPKSWLTPGIHLATNYGTDTLRISTCPVPYTLVTVPDRYSRTCTLYVEIPPTNLIDDDTDLNVVQLSPGETKVVPISIWVETMVFLANCDGDVEVSGGPSPDQPMKVRLHYADGSSDSTTFDSIHPAGRFDITDPSFPPSNLFIFGNEVFVCDPHYYNGTYIDGAHSEAWHWYAIYPDTAKVLDSIAFVGIQSGSHSEIYIAAVSYASVTQSTSNPVGRWRFDEGSGDTAYDDTDNHNDGTIRDASWSDPLVCPPGHSLYFHGGGQFEDNDRVFVPHSPSLDITGEITVAAWIRAEPTGNYRAIVDKFEGGSTIPSCGYSLYLGGGFLRFIIYSGTAGHKECAGTTDLRDNDTHFVAGVWDGGHVRVYVDGVQQNEAPYTLPPASTSNGLGIGLRPYGWGGYMPFLGQIDEVRIYDRALTPQEMVQLFMDPCGSGTTFIPPPSPARFSYIDSVPDWNQPPASGSTNYCAPTAALNILDYWQIGVPRLVSGLVDPADASAYPVGSATADLVGYFMCTNGTGSPNRLNPPPPNNWPGTHYVDQRDGLAEYILWNWPNQFAAGEPTLPSWKIGYVDTVSLYIPGGIDSSFHYFSCEIDSGWPAKIDFTYWNPIDIDTAFIDPATQDTIYLHRWGTYTGSSGPPDPEEQWGGEVGHAVTGVGYITGWLGTDWAIVHDNWPSTHEHMALPWGNFMALISVPPANTICRPGDADGSGAIVQPPFGIGDVTYLVYFVFCGGPPPVPYGCCSGDANCDCNVDIDDMVYLINFIFSGGAAPCSCTQWNTNCSPPMTPRPCP